MSKIKDNEELLKALEELGIPTDVLLKGEDKEEDAPELDEDGNPIEKEKKEEKEEKIEKALPSDDLLKGIANLLDKKFEAIDDVIEKAVNTATEGINDRVEYIEKALEAFGEQRLGKKSVQNANFLQKGIAKDDEGKTILSKVLNMDEISKAVEDLIADTPEPELQKAFEDELISLNAGGAPLSKGTLDRLDKRGIVIR
jgi:hypothetical protein